MEENKSAKLLNTEYCYILVTKDLTGFELPPLPVPKSEPQADSSGVSKPDLKELLFSLIDYVMEPLESFKKKIFNDKNVSFK